MKITQIALILGVSVSTAPAVAAPIAATADGLLGMYSAADFRLIDGACTDCNTIPQALWYFEGEAVAAPTHSADFSRTEPAQADVATWMHGRADLTAQPPLVWLGSSKVIQEATLATDSKTLVEKDGATHAFAVTPKIPTNLSYWNRDTLQFFAQRPLRLRGEMQNGVFVARTVWPLDNKILADGKVASLTEGETLKSLVQFEHGGAQSPFQARLLWERNPGAAQKSAGKAVVGLMLNGAQGDDDEAHGGHFGVVTGRFEADGNWSRWLVNNFYNLDAYSEKGIIAAATPMDKYLMDLNSGQSYYRPSYLLVATFREDHPAALYQAAINRVYNHFYRHDFVYDHSRDNCAGTSIDTFRTLGWHVPTRGVESYVKATGAYFYMSATERSLEKGRKIYDYLTTETTRLYPAVAFDAMGSDLINLVHNDAGRELTPLEQEMAQNIEAIWFVRIPQIPSSRVYGMAPVYSFDQYMHEAPADHGQWKIIPVPPRPFPEQLRDGLALQQNKPFLVPWPVTCLSLVLLWAGYIVVRRWRRRKSHQFQVWH
jgi:hypothetical protein